jgi:hypothetical protein
MAITITTPPPWPAGLSPYRVCRNGAAPDGAAARMVASHLHQTLGRRLKVLARIAVRPDDAIYDENSDVTIWRFLAHTSPVACDWICQWAFAPCRSIDADLDPHAYVVTKALDLAANPATESGAVTHAGQYVTKRDDGAGAAAVPDAYVYRQQPITGLLAATTYAIEVHAVAGCRPIALTIAERPRVSLTVGTDLCVDPSQLQLGGAVWDAQTGAIATALDAIWHSGGPGLVGWSTPAGAAVTRNGSEVNILDGATAAWAATSPGWRVWPQYHGSYGSDTGDIPCRAYVYAETDSGTGGSATFARSAGAIVQLTGIGATAGYYHAACALDSGEASEKIDVLAGCPGADTVSVWAAGLIELDAS